MDAYDAVVVGSGPNGLAAAVTLARAGQSVLVLEAKATVGGGTRTLDLTLPGFVHDVCSAVHPSAVSSPFFRSLPLHQHGLEWIHPGAPLAHPLDDGTAVILERSVDKTAGALGVDGQAWRDLFAPMAERADDLLDAFLAPLWPPRRPLLMARYGPRFIRSATSLAQGTFKALPAQSLFAGIAAHSVTRLESPASASFGLMLGMMAHAYGWPIARGGSQAIANALAAYLRTLGGEVRIDAPVNSLQDIPDTRAVFFDLAPKEILRIAADPGNPGLAPGVGDNLSRFRHGPAAFKVDWALSGPIPWKAADCARAGTVHLGGTIDEIAASARLEPGAAPFVLLAQPSLFDRERAPEGKHTAWAYCHVPNGSTVDMTDAIERQVERYAPGFRHLILARHTISPAQFEAYNPNDVGGDVVGGANDLWQVIARPKIFSPYNLGRLEVRGARCEGYICSASTPPGGGVHGMCGYNAATQALGSLAPQR